MKKLCLALVALSLTAPALAADDLAPAVKRKPAAAATTAPGAAQARAPSVETYRAALAPAAAKEGDDALLDTSLVKVMSQLLAAGQCTEAVDLANRDRRKALADRAQQFCK